MKLYPSKLRYFLLIILFTLTLLLTAIAAHAYGDEGWGWSSDDGWTYDGTSVDDGPTTEQGVAYDPADDPVLIDAGIFPSSGDNGGNSPLGPGAWYTDPISHETGFYTANTNSPVVEGQTITVHTVDGKTIQVVVDNAPLNAITPDGTRFFDYINPLTGEMGIGIATPSDSGEYWPDIPQGGGDDGGGDEEPCGPCSPGDIRCSGSDYQVCSPSCQWVTQPNPAEADCSDSVDNDCDTMIDCKDSDCAGSIQGNVKDTEDNKIDDSRIDALGIKGYSEYSNPSGNYKISYTLCGAYKITASASGYVSETKSITLAPKENLKNMDFTLISSTTCKDDCTYAGDDLIHKECDGINGCEFCDETTKQICNLAQPGWIREYDTTREVECAEGCPQPKTDVKATVTCEGQNIIKLTKVITYKGKLTKLVVVTCK
ncbi:MAG: carboxypeptidase-like regulatory domain-containing protein [Candidatus Woesearchaeota archaeon]